MDPQSSVIIDKSQLPAQTRVSLPGGRRRARAFARSLSIAKAAYGHLLRGPVWLCLVSTERDRVAFKRLSAQDRRFVLIDPKLEHSAESFAAQEGLVVRYPGSYRSQLRLSLRLCAFGIAGVVVGRDLAPWVRHLVSACKAVGVRTVLISESKLEPSALAEAPVARDASELLAKKPWAIPSAYSSESTLADGPVCDYVLSLSETETRAWQALGYPIERVLPLAENAPPQAEEESLRDALFGKDEAVGQGVAKIVSSRLLSRPFHEPKPYDPSNYEWLFSGTLREVAHPGVVAYHREIDEASVFVPAMLGYRRVIVPSCIEQAQVADIFARWGGLAGEHRKIRIERLGKRLGCPALLLEDGLFRSIEIGLSGAPTVSIMLDDQGAYYDATKPNRLERLLSSLRKFSPEELSRAERCIQSITAHRLSKYNHAPDHPLPFETGCVLVVDQRKGDLSVEKGLGSDDSFRQMLLCASRENPNKTVLVKRHPDAMSGGKGSYFNNETLARWGTLPNVVLVDFETNPHRLFDCCDKVYVVSSGMGFEALMRGLEVHCFGMPFYAGWGITKDQMRCRRRWRSRSLLEVFYAACILHSRYFNPKTMRPCSLEAVIEYLAEARDAKQRLLGPRAI